MVPDANTSPVEAMARYVILKHDPPAGVSQSTHWDLMFDTGTVLRTWSLPARPALNTPLDAVQLADHRRAYLDYEGPVSGNRGMVTRQEHGVYTIQTDEPCRFVIHLQSPTGSYRLQLTRPHSDSRIWTAVLTPSS